MTVEHDGHPPRGPLRGGCGGFGIHSDLEFETLRPGGGDRLDVVHAPHPADRSDRPVVVWEARPGNPFKGRLYRDDAGYDFWASDGGWFTVNVERREIRCSEPHLRLRGELRLFGVPLSILAFAVGDVSIHAAAVELPGGAVLLAGPSQYGKTTLAGALAAAGHRLLTEDSTRVATEAGPRVFPGPAVLRLRQDIADAVSIPGARVVEADQDRRPLIFGGGARGDAAPVALRAVVVLRETTEEVSLRPYAPAAAARDLMALTFVPPERRAAGMAFERLVDLTAAVEVLELRRPKVREAIPTVVSLLERHASRSV